MSPSEWDWARINTPSEWENASLNRNDVVCHCGLVDGPVTYIALQRGDSKEAILKELNELQRRLKMTFAEGSETFCKANLEDIYLVFSDDCGECNVVSEKKRAIAPHIENWGIYLNEWNVLGNFEFGDPVFLEVWDRRKIPLLEAAGRISRMERITH